MEQVPIIGWELWQVVDSSAIKRIQIPFVVAEPNSFLLFERTDDNTIASVVADGVYVGGFNNQGVDALMLMDALRNTIDEFAMPGQWPAGSAKPRASMALVNGVWETSQAGCEFDADGKVVNGTPKVANEKVECSWQANQVFLPLVIGGER